MTMTITDRPGFGSGPVEDDPAVRLKWTGTQKAAVVAALRDDLITDEEACEIYGLTPEEIAAWQRTLDSLGVRKRAKPKAD